MKMQEMEIVKNVKLWKMQHDKLYMWHDMILACKKLVKNVTLKLYHEQNVARRNVTCKSTVKNSNSWSM